MTKQELSPYPVGAVGEIALAIVTLAMVVIIAKFKGS
jgi:hypothetical protein